MIPHFPYQPCRAVIAGAKLREGTTTILPRGGERSRESACLQCAFTPLAGDPKTTKTNQHRLLAKTRPGRARRRRPLSYQRPNWRPTKSFGTWGVSKGPAEDLARQFESEVVHHWISVIRNDQGIQDPPAYVVKALREGWQLPAARSRVQGS